jgi:hypothetical protein
MAPTPFTKNHTDHSNNTGFQFEFHCDKCGNGYRSTFQVSKLGVAAGLLRAAGSIFGGSFGSVGAGADHVKDALRGEAWDSAFKEAVEEIRPKFRQCTKCGHWVCPEVCWNEERGMCEDCAPNLQEHAAAIQAQVAVEQVWEKARKVDQTDGMDVSAKQAASCPKCGAGVQPKAKFCSSCGSPVGQKAKRFCAECGGELLPTAKFCGGCGAKAG